MVTKFLLLLRNQTRPSPPSVSQEQQDVGGRNVQIVATGGRSDQVQMTSSSLFCRCATVGPFVANELYLIASGRCGSRRSTQSLGTETHFRPLLSLTNGGISTGAGGESRAFATPGSRPGHCIGKAQPGCLPVDSGRKPISLRGYEPRPPGCRLLAGLGHGAHIRACGPPRALWCPISEQMQRLS